MCWYSINKLSTISIIIAFIIFQFIFFFHSKKKIDEKCAHSVEIYCPPEYNKTFAVDAHPSQKMLVVNTITPPSKKISLVVITSVRHKYFCDYLIPSLEAFLKYQDFELNVVTDPGTENSAKLLKDCVGNKFQVNFYVTNYTNQGPWEGHTYQQYLTFYIDQYANYENIGVVDTDSVLHLYMEYENLMLKDRPRATYVDRYFEHHDYNRSLQILGLEAFFDGMSTFPVMMKRSSMKQIRDFIQTKLNKPSFLDAFKLWEKREKLLCQFCVMGMHEWYFNHDKYDWHINNHKDSEHEFFHFSHWKWDTEKAKTFLKYSYSLFFQDDFENLPPNFNNFVEIENENHSLNIHKQRTRGWTFNLKDYHKLYKLKTRFDDLHKNSTDYEFRKLKIESIIEKENNKI